MNTAFTLFDTMSREKREIAPSDGVQYRFYCCGPTVYGPAHIGNFRTFVVQDVFRRVLEVAGLNPLHVRNITNVDDKTIRDSQANCCSLSEFTEGWTARFHQDCEALNLLPPHHELGAVEAIPLQIELIERLIEKEHAYRTDDGSVYFRIASFPAYGRLSRLQEREITTDTAAQRVDDDEYGEDEPSAADFALWKGRKPEDGDNFWDSPWGEGRPGWHIECSAMSMSILGETFDLHAGGEDLVFPHHENEIAQSEAATGKPFALHWFHSSHLMVDGKKMSKSLGNLYTLDDIVAKGHSPMDMRYNLLSGLYRRTLNFTLDGLSAASQATGRLRHLEGLFTEKLGPAPDFVPDGNGVSGPFEKAWLALLDDLNVPKSLGEVFTAAKEVAAGMQNGSLDDVAAADARTSFQGILFALGFKIEAPEPAAEAPEEIQALAQKRWEAKQAKDWAAADALRDEITAAGWEVKDTREGFELHPVS